MAMDRAWTKRVGTADDFDESDASTILTFWEAQTQSKVIARGDQEGSARKAPLTVERATIAYLGSLEARNQRTANDARLRLNRLFLPRFGTTHIADLTRTTLESWRDSLVRAGGDPEQRRKSQDNRQSSSEHREGAAKPCCRRHGERAVERTVRGGS